jgi:hypothetical protein
VSDWDSLQRERSRCLSVMSTLEDALQRQLSRKTPQWVGFGLTVVDRGAFAIFPLAMAVVTGGRDSADETLLSELEDALWQHWGYWYGGHDYRLGSFDPDDEYGRRLTAAGAHGRGPRWWRVKDFAVVFVRSFDERRERETLSLHAIPLDWAREPVNAGTKRDGSRYRRTLRRLDEAEVVWSWPAEQPAEQPTQEPGDGRGDQSGPVDGPDADR